MQPATPVSASMKPVSIFITTTCPALISGRPQDERLEEWKAIVAKNRFRITLNLNQGDGTFRLLTSDLSEAYVDFNKSE